jgi:hypothetical protein
MADVTDVQLVLWSNTRARTISDNLTIINNALLAYKTDYTAQGISTKAVAASGNNIADGYATDGRQPITGTKLINLKAALDQLDTAINTTLVSGVGATPASIIAGLQVNGSDR